MTQLLPSFSLNRTDAGLQRDLEDPGHSFPDGFEIFHSLGWHSLVDGGIVMAKSIWLYGRPWATSCSARSSPVT